MKIKNLLILCFLNLLLVNSSFAMTEDKMASDFKLKSVDGKEVSLSEFKGKTVVLEWFNFKCPFVQKHYKNGDMQALQKKWTDKGVVWLAIDSTNAEHQNYADLAKLKSTFTEAKINATNLLADADGKVGNAYGAKTTPHMFIINKEGHTVYQGAIDEDPDPSADPKKTKNFIDLALAEVLAGKDVSIKERKPYGCSVKY